MNGCGTSYERGRTANFLKHSGKCQSFPILGKYPTKNFRFRIQWDLDEDGREVEQSW